MMHFFIFSAASPPSSRIFLKADDEAVGVGPALFFLVTATVVGAFVPELEVEAAGFFGTGFTELVLVFAPPDVGTAATAAADAASTEADPVKAPPPACAVASPVPPDKFKPAIPGAFGPTK